MSDSSNNVITSEGSDMDIDETSENEESENNTTNNISTLVNLLSQNLQNDFNPEPPYPWEPQPSPFILSPFRSSFEPDSTLTTLNPNITTLNPNLTNLLTQNIVQQSPVQNVDLSRNLMDLSMNQLNTPSTFFPQNNLLTSRYNESRTPKK